MATIKAKTDKSIIEKLKNAFTSPSCLLTEAMQNARRANASKVVFLPMLGKKNTLKIIDDGDGIDDLQAFLTLSGSGWEQEVIEKEGAFGMGTYSMLYACEHIRVESNGKMFEGATEDILSGMDIEVKPTQSAQKGTIITLMECVLDNKDVHSLLAEKARGFAIPVYWGDKEIPRPYRLEGELEFMDTPIGKIHLKGVDQLVKQEKVCNSLGERNSLLFYQGLPVGSEHNSSSYHRKRLNIIHLEETMFDIRMPDRDVLISHNDQEDRIRKTVCSVWKERLKQAKKTWPAQRFAEELFDTLQCWESVALLNDVEYLPGIVFKVDQTPYQEKFFSEVETTIISTSKSDLEDKKLLRLSRFCNDDTIIEWNYAYYGDFLCCYTNDLDPEHWVFEYIEPLEDVHLEVSMINPGEATSYWGDWCGFTVFPGDAVKIEGPIGDVIVDDNCIFVGEECEGSGMYIPKKALNGSDITQASSFVYDEQWDETAENREEGLFAVYLLNLNVTKEKAIIDFLNGSSVGMLGIQNQTINVDFDEKGKVTAVVLAA